MNAGLYRAAPLISELAGGAGWAPGLAFWLAAGLASTVAIAALLWLVRQRQGLRRRVKLLELALDAVPAAVTIQAGQAGPVFGNRAAGRLEWPERWWDTSPATGAGRAAFAFDRVSVPGDVRHYQAGCERVRLDGRELEIGVATDITALRRQERALAVSRDLYRSLFEQSADPVLLVRDNRIAQCNVSAMDVFRANTLDELLGRTVGALSPDCQPDGLRSDQTIRDVCARTLAGLPTQECAWRFQRLDGRIFDGRMMLTAVESEGQAALLVTVRDESARHRAEQELTLSRQRMNLALEAAELGEWQRNLETDQIQVSPRWRTMLGIAPDAAIDNYFYYWLERIHPQDKAGTVQALQNYLDGQSECYRAEYRFFHPLRQWIWLRETGRVVERRADGAPRSIVCLLMDISERKHGARALQDGQDRLLLAMASARMGLWEWEIQSGQRSASDSLLEIAGCGPDDYPQDQSGWLARVHPDDRDHVVRQLNDHFEGATSGYGAEFRFAHPERQWIWLYDAGHIVERDAAGAPVRMIGLHMDITQRKEMELALRDREENLRVMLDSIGDAVIATDARGRIVQMNPVAERLTGWRGGEALGRDLAEVYPTIDTETRMPCEHPVSRLMRGGRGPESGRQISLVSRQGIEYQIAENGAPIASPGRAAAGAILVFRDVTDQYRQECARQAGEEMFRLLFENNSDALACLDCGPEGPDQPAVCRFVSVNPAFERIMGLAAVQVAGRELTEVWPALESGWPRRFAKVALGGGVEPVEWHHASLGRHFRGSIFRVQSHAGRVALSLTDVTGQMEARRTTEAGKDRLERILQAASCLIVIMDDRFVIQFINQYGRQMLGALPAPGAGQAGMAWLLGGDRAAAQLRRRLGEVDPGEAVSTVTRLDSAGDEPAPPVWIGWSCRRLTDPAGGPAEIIAVGIDLTGRKRLEESLRQARNELQRHSDHMEDLVRQRTGQLEREREKLNETVYELRSTQTQLIQTEKMAVLGQLIAGIVHEISSPLGAINSSNATIRQNVEALLDNLVALARWLTGPQGPLVHDLLMELRVRERTSLTTREQREQRGRIGQALAGANVPAADDIAGHLVDMGLQERWEPYQILFAREGAGELVHYLKLVADLARSNQIIDIAIQKTNRTVTALKMFAHQKPRQEGLELRDWIDVRQGLETVLILYDNKLKQGVKLDKQFGAVPPVHACFEELNQVWSNLILNALQAMNYAGELSIRVAPEGRGVAVAIADSGCGIPSGKLDQVFEPLYTTKPAGEGTGLGLSICQEIVKKHQGSITVRSEVGHGATFTVWLPAASQSAPAGPDTPAPLPAGAQAGPV